MKNIKTESDNLRWDVYYTRVKPKFYTSNKEDQNPFKNISRQKKYTFLTDWQVCDEEHLE